MSMSHHELLTHHGWRKEIGGGYTHKDHPNSVILADSKDWLHSPASPTKKPKRGTGNDSLATYLTHLHGTVGDKLSQHSESTPELERAYKTVTDEVMEVVSFTQQQFAEKNATHDSILKKHGYKFFLSTSNQHAQYRHPNSDRIGVSAYMDKNTYEHFPKGGGRHWFDNHADLDKHLTQHHATQHSEVTPERAKELMGESPIFGNKTTQHSEETVESGHVTAERARELVNGNNNPLVKYKP